MQLMNGQCGIFDHISGSTEEQCDQQLRPLMHRDVMHDTPRDRTFSRAVFAMALRLKGMPALAQSNWRCNAVITLGGSLPANCCHRFIKTKEKNP
jgi:hypothetical protein